MHHELLQNENNILFLYHYNEKANDTTLTYTNNMTMNYTEIRFKYNLIDINKKKKNTKMTQKDKITFQKYA